MTKSVPPQARRGRFSFYVPHERVYALTTVVDKAGRVITPESRTKQSHKDECDINNIIKSFKVTGMVQHVRQNAAQGAYADLPDPMDFQEALNLVAQAELAFDSLPSKVRDRFGNNAQAFLAFTSDPANAKEMAELGLINPEPVKPPPQEVVILGGEGGAPPSDASSKAGKPA